MKGKPKRTQKIEDQVVRLSFNYDGRRISSETKNRLEEIKDAFFDSLVEMTDNLCKGMQDELDGVPAQDETITVTVRIA